MLPEQSPSSGSGGGGSPPGNVVALRVVPMRVVGRLVTAIAPAGSSLTGALTSLTFTFSEPESAVSGEQQPPTWMRYLTPATAVNAARPSGTDSVDARNKSSAQSTCWSPPKPLPTTR